MILSQIIKYRYVEYSNHSPFYYSTGNCNFSTGSYKLVFRLSDGGAGHVQRRHVSDLRS
jgi:hypothetical protein